jgi:hypothetical protein
MKRGATVSTRAAVASPVALALYVNQPTAYPGYPAFVRLGGEEPVADGAAVALEPILYTGRPEGHLRGQCSHILFSPLVGCTRSFLTGLRPTGIASDGMAVFVGDCKRNYKNSREAGKTLIVVRGGPEPCRPAYMLVFVLKRLYARRRASCNAVYAQQFFRAYVRPRMGIWLNWLCAIEAGAIEHEGFEQ